MYHEKYRVPEPDHCRVTGLAGTRALPAASQQQHTNTGLSLQTRVSSVLCLAVKVPRGVIRARNRKGKGNPFFFKKKRTWYFR